MSVNGAAAFTAAEVELPEPVLMPSMSKSKALSQPLAERVDAERAFWV